MIKLVRLKQPQFITHGIWLTHNPKDHFTRNTNKRFDTAKPKLQKRRDPLTSKMDTQEGRLCNSFLTVIFYGLKNRTVTHKQRDTATKLVNALVYEAGHLLPNGIEWDKLLITSISSLFSFSFHGSTCFSFFLSLCLAVLFINFISIFGKGNRQG